MDTLLITLFVIVCILLIIVVLLQKGRGGGLGAAFGGMGSSAFGTRVGDVFTWVTIVLTGLFLLLAIVTSMVMRPEADQVLPPYFVPPGGAHEEDKTVTIGCATLGATIHFTLDGSEPTPDSPRYEGPLKVALGKTLKARAYRSDWQPSEVAVATYEKAEPATAPREAPATQPAVETAPAGPPTSAPATAPKAELEPAPATKPAPSPTTQPAGVP